MKNTGALLKKAREQNKLTISEVSLATKISPRVLQAMESGETSELPAPSFVKGFIRSYALLLKLEPDEFLNSYNEEQNSINVDESVNELIQPTEQDQITTEPFQNSEPVAKPSWILDIPLIKDTSMTSKIIAVIGILILVLIIISVKNIVQKYENESIVTTPPPELQSLDHSKVDDSQPTNISNNNEIENKNESIDANKQQTQEQAKQDVQVNKLSDQKPAEKELTQPTPEPQNNTINSGPQEIILEALDRVKIDFRIDGGQLKSMTLEPDQVHTIKASSSIAIDLADGGAVNLIHNGKDLGVPGDLGKPKKVKFP